MANDMLQAYLMSELEELNEYSRKPGANSFPSVKLIWTASKTELIKLIYALDTSGCFNHGKVPLTQIAAYFESVYYGYDDFTKSVGCVLSNLPYYYTLRSNDIRWPPVGMKCFVMGEFQYQPPIDKNWILYASKVYDNGIVQLNYSLQT